MPDPVSPAQINTEAGKASEDVKTGDTLLNDDPKAQVEGQPPVAAKPAEGVEPKPKEGIKDVKAPEGAPERYEFKALEGVTLDPELVIELSTVSKELNLSQPNAQRFADLGNKLVDKTVKTYESKMNEAWAESRKEWVDEIKNDKEYGGAAFEVNREIALRAVRFAGIPELKEVFDTGWGDHPALFKAFVKFGKALGEDRLIDPDVNGAAKKTAAEVLYPNQGKT